MGPDSYLVVVQDVHSAFGHVRWPTVPGDLRLAHDAHGLQVWARSQAPSLRVTSIGASTVLIGSAYRAGSANGGVAEPFDPTVLQGCSPEAACGRLIREAWGRYVVVGRTSSTLWAFRDPSGALDCVTWGHGGLRYFASGADEEVDALLPPTLSLDWSVVVRQLQDPPAVAGASGLRGLDTIAAGGFWCARDGAGESARQLWRPGQFARRGLHGVADPMATLRDRVHTCVATLGAPFTQILGEISGGLDSAIVADALAQAAALRPDLKQPIHWVHQSVDELESDERRYARSVARRLGVVLNERAKPPLRYTEAALTVLGADVRVGLTALDTDYDADMAALARADGAGAIFTGQGGDVVFFQMASLLVLADRFRGERRLHWHELVSYARRWRRSIWGAFGTAAGRAVWPGRPRGGLIPAYVTERVRERRPFHPWLADLGGVAPAKAAQIRALVGAQNVFGPSLRGRAAQLLHPLLSQPVVELTLALRTYDLAQGELDRALARDAFASHLPSDVRERQSKGSLQAFYGRAVADSLDVLRPWLLDGLLAQEGLIRREQLEPLLDADVLIWRDVYVEVLHAAALEAWVRGWSARIKNIRRRSPAEPVRGYLRESGTPWRTCRPGSPD